MLVTLGTGIGTAVFIDGVLLPNTELGHIQMGKTTAERYAADSVRENKKLKWKAWADRLDEVFALYEFYLSPDLIIVGGGVSKKYEKFLPRLKRDAKVIPATLLNEAGIVGAALAAKSLLKSSK